LSFYQRKEVKDIIAYMRLFVNPKDEEALRRIINFPKRGIGATTLDKIAQIAEANNQTLWEAPASGECRCPNKELFVEVRENDQWPAKAPG
jgi:DNA helicase-2/ATP-dependent DNA helicase PcrA